MIKIINGVAEKVLPWHTLSSAKGTIIFTPTDGKDYIAREDVIVTAEMLDTLYEETAECFWNEWTGSNFVVAVHGADDDYLEFTDDEIEGMTLDEIADYIFNIAIGWFEETATATTNE